MSLLDRIRVLTADAAAPHQQEKITNRLVGLTTWAGLFLCIVGLVYYPVIVQTAALGFMIYLFGATLGIIWFYHIGRMCIHQWEQRGWEADALPSGSLPLNQVQHVVLLPNYREPEALTVAALTRLADQRDAHRNMTVVLAMEGREHGAYAKAQRLAEQFEGQFAHILISVHPANLPDELPCKGANMNWAARFARKALVDQHGLSLDQMTLTALDADTQLHCDYFAALGWLFASSGDRYGRFWQSPHIYHANLEKVTLPVQMFTSLTGATQLARLANPDQKVLPQGTLSLSFRLADQIGYWDPASLADDWHVYLRAFFKTDGKVEVEPIYLPALTESVEGATLWQALWNRYRQTLRHSWGAEEIGYTLRKLQAAQNISMSEKVGQLLCTIQDHLLSVVGWAVIILGLAAPLITARASDGLGWVVAAMFALVITALGALWVLDVAYAPREKRQWRAVKAVITWLLLPLFMLVLLALPALHAHTLMLLGMNLGWSRTPRQQLAVSD